MGRDPARGDRGRAAGLRWIGLILAGALVAACATGPRIRPVAGAGAVLETESGSVKVEAEGVELVVRPSSWRGRPSDLGGYVTPFHLVLVNGSAWPLSYDYADLRLFDDARFQYTALPPIEVGRLLRWGGDPVVLASAEASVTVAHRRRSLAWDPWWWGPPYYAPWWWGPPYYYPPWPSYPDDVFLEALPVATLQPAARTQGFVYFPRLRREARQLTFEFHYRLGNAARVFTLPFEIEQSSQGIAPRASPERRAEAFPRLN
jgi:hypothetical protein